MNIWEKQKGESNRAYYNFKVYLELGNDRDIKKTGELLNKSSSNLYKQCKKWNWENRAIEFDKYISDNASIEQKVISGFDKISKLRIKQAMGFANTFQNLLILIQNKIENKLVSLNEMELEDILKLSLSLSKAIPEIIKALKLMVADSPIEEKGNINILEQIKEDPNTYALAQELLETISRD